MHLTVFCKNALNCNAIFVYKSVKSSETRGRNQNTKTHRLALMTKKLEPYTDRAAERVHHT